MDGGEGEEEEKSKRRDSRDEGTQLGGDHRKVALSKAMNGSTPLSAKLS